MCGNILKSAFSMKKLKTLLETNLTDVQLEIILSETQFWYSSWMKEFANTRYEHLYLKTKQRAETIIELLIARPDLATTELLGKADWRVYEIIEVHADLIHKCSVKAVEHIIQIEKLHAGSNDEYVNLTKALALLN